MAEITNIKDERFESCWLAYNRKGAKKVALAQWEKLSDEAKEMVERHIPHYVSSRERFYCKDFERYLRDHVFENPVFDRKGNLIYDPDERQPQTHTQYTLDGFQG